jgi:hypothetical protein
MGVCPHFSGTPARLLPPLHPGWSRDHLHLSIPNLENIAQVVDMGQNEVHVPELIRAPEKVDAAAA